MLQGLKGLVCLAVLLRRLTACKQKRSFAGFIAHLFKSRFSWTK